MRVPAGRAADGVLGAEGEMLDDEAGVFLFGVKLEADD
jgi:hypothetical protein